MNQPASRVALFCCIAANAHAFTTGISGYSGKDGPVCTECHSGGTAKPSAMLQGPPAMVAGSSADFQLVIDTDVNSSASAKRSAGFDIAAGAGTLATVDQVNQTRVVGGEISHTTAVPAAKTVAISFSLTAPDQPGSMLTLYAAALSVDSNGAKTGDSLATTTLQVAVTASPPDLADVVSGASTRDHPTDDMGPPKDEPRWACGSYAGAMPVPVAVGPMLAILLLALLLRRRVR
jgi:hypothetical protein